jgi:peroxiredoxin
VSHPLVGHLAPDFTLTNQAGKSITLSDLRGTPVLLIFASFASSPMCTDELRGIRDSEKLQEAGAVHILIVTCDSVHALKAWGEQNHYRDDLLSDFWPHGEVARWYGIFNPRRGIATRASFLIASDGVVRWAVVHAPEDPRSVDDYLAAIHAL